jgi:RHS repeat-associated protein
MFDASGITSSVFDPFDELTSTTNGRNKTTTYGYDVDGDVTGITFPLGSGATWASTDTAAYSYDHADQLASVTDFNGHTSNVTVSADGLPTAFTLGASGDTVSTSYAANDAPSSITLGNGSTLQEFAYSDAPSGGILSETDTPSSALSPADYVYDAQSRVTSDTPGSGGAKSYVEDASGNLTTTPTGASGTYDYASELTSSALSGTTTSYTYDASGNRLGASVGGSATVTATYNGASELTSYSNAASNMTTATYDGDGLRTADTTGSATQHFIWNEVTSIPELLMDSTNAYIYGPSGTPFEQVTLSGGTIHYLDSDALGSVRGVVNSGGSLTASTSYDAWGNPETTGGLTSYTPVGYAGGYTDAANLVYFINRYYDSTTGQFVSVDPMVIRTSQAYSYVGDDPVNGVDPLGLWGWNPVSDLTQTWNDTGGKIVTYTAQHWRGIVTIAAVAGGALVVIGTGGAAILAEGAVASALETAASAGVLVSTIANGTLCVATKGSGKVIACVAAVAGAASPYLKYLGESDASFWSQGQYLWDVGVGGATSVMGWATAVNQVPYTNGETDMCKL